MSALPDRNPGQPNSQADVPVRRQLSTRYNARAEHDDYEFGPARGGYQNPTNAGMIGFILALVSLGLVVIGLVLLYFMDLENRQQPNAERTRWMLYWFMFLDVVCFFSALTATIMGARGLTPTNPLYRGYSVAALILGILELVLASILGIVLFCCGLVFEVFHNPGMG